jgi:haloalkane dehalogenase
MQALRTPDDRFQNLPGYAFSPHYIEADGLRIHYVDEGSRQGDPVLLLHGEPSWSFLYRKMIPVLTEAGYRVLAPDLVGFGKSDKPVAKADYTYARHVAWMTALVEMLDLRDVTLFVQDWGGLIGLRVAAEHPDRFARIVAANTGLPTGDQRMPDAFRAWRETSQRLDPFPAGGIVGGGTVTDLSAEVVAGYDAPFPDERYKAGAIAFPLLVPMTPDDPAAEANRRAWQVLSGWKKPFLTAFSDRDPITRGGERVFQKLVPGAQGQAHTTIEGAGHFLQEDKGDEVARVVVEFIEKNRS